MTCEIEESERQMILLALAILSLRRPGWHYAAGGAAEKLNGREMFEKFRSYNPQEEVKQNGSTLK